MPLYCIGTPDLLRDPKYTPALGRAIPSGIQHVLVMFESNSNATPAMIAAGAADFGFGSTAPDFSQLL